MFTAGELGRNPAPSNAGFNGARPVSFNPWRKACRRIAPAHPTHASAETALAADKTCK
jgi:hypothetical protein